MQKPFRLLVAVALVMGPTLPALAQSSPTTITPDRSQVLVNKDIAGQRWAIARNVNNGAVTGNVFTPGSNDPQFVYCDQTGETSADYNYRCSGMGRCTVSDCATAWNFVSQVTLPKSFFAAGGPAPTPVPSSGLAGLIGTWQFNYVILTNFSQTYRLQRLVTTSSGLNGLQGLDSLGDAVAVLRIQDALPGSTLPYEFYLLDPGVLICRNFFFNRSGNSVSGVYVQTDAVGNDCGTDFNNTYPMSGSRISTATGLASPSELSPSLAIDLEALMQAEDAAVVSNPSPEVASAAAAFLRAISPNR